MKQRCYNKNNPKYKNYGARGIRICDEWLNDVSAFIKWSLDNGYDDTLSIDRINVDGDYEPSNCRWATNAEQALNRTDNRLLTYNGVTMTMKEWADKYNLPYKLVESRINSYGWSIERALTEPIHAHYGHSRNTA
jgi:hypothetical protein